METEGQPAAALSDSGSFILPLDNERAPPQTVEELQRELEFYRSENERKQKELEDITQVCRAVMEKLHVLTCHINDKEKEEELERAQIGKEMKDLFEALQSAEEEVNARDDELRKLKGEPPGTEQRKFKRLSQQFQQQPLIQEQQALQALQQEQQQAGGEQQAQQPKQNLLQLKATWEDELKQLNETLQSAEEAIKHQADRLEEKKAEKAKAVSLGGPRSDRGEDFDFRLKVMPREFLEKQVKRYKEALENERNAIEELKEEKMAVEEELMQMRLVVGEKDLEISTLQSGKEALELYVAELAEEMEKETSQMVSMKDYFKVESKRLSDTADIILHTPNKALSLSTELANSAAELPISSKLNSSESTSPPKKGRTSLLTLSPIMPRTANELWDHLDDDESFEVDDDVDDDDVDEGEEGEGQGEKRKEKKQVTFVDIVDSSSEQESNNGKGDERLRKVKERVKDLAAELDRVKKEAIDNNNNNHNTLNNNNNSNNNDDESGQVTISKIIEGKEEIVGLAKQQEQELLAEIDRLEKKNISKKERLVKLKEQNAEQKGLIDKLKAEKVVSEKIIEQLNKQPTTTVKEINENENEREKEREKENEERVRKLAEEIEKNERVIEKLKKDNGELKDSVDRWQREHEQSQILAAQLRAQIDRLEEEGTKKKKDENEREKVEEEKERQQKEIEELRQQLQQQLQQQQQLERGEEKQQEKILRERREEEEEAIIEAKLAAEEEITYLKKELFFALAVAIKLNLTIEGRQCNQSVISIYERACKENVSYSEWQDWIPAQLSESQ